MRITLFILGMLLLSCFALHAGDIPRPEYPRPQFERSDWINLNGEWTYVFDFGRSGSQHGFAESKGFDDKILVPFCPESKLSGVEHKDFIEMMWYHRKINVPESWKDKKVLLHFGAVDYECEVFIDGKSAGIHYGGTSSFYIEITRFVRFGEEQDLVVYVKDELRSGDRLAQHYWWHYEFSGDEEFLRSRAYPFIKGVAQFYEDYLIPDPRPDSRFYGMLVPVPSYSPENFFVGGIQPVSLCIGATSDLQLIYDVLTHAITASEILGSDQEKRNQWKKILEQIPPLQIGKYGQLQEWLEDYEEGEPGHRHISHLFGLFPGEQITIEDTPELAKAAKVSLERRIANGGSFVGFTSNMWARLGEGDRALQQTKQDSMFFSFTPFYFSSTVAEMLLQSHGNRIRLLPALPSNWYNG